MTLRASFRARVGSFAVEADLAAAEESVLAILGPNGSGKSTMLAALAGHLPIESGEIRLGNRVLDGDGVHVVPARRRVGFLGQRPLLFPHLSALENVAFGPRAQGVARARARADAGSWLERVGLGDLAGSRPAALSGGQQQRVALARALAARPDALLLDEPFAALDVETAAQARRLVAEERDAAGIPIVLVTHDPLDAVVLAKRTAVVQDGRIAQQGPTADVLGHPGSAFVAALAGVNLVSGAGTGRGTVRADGIEWTGAGDVVPAQFDATVAFAPGSVRLRSLGDIAHAPNTWNGTVATLEPLPGGIRLRTMQHPGIAIDVPSAVAVAAGVAPGIRLRFTVHPDDVSVQVSALR
ncbi:sulfate/molybdate ABC transporter ATP-binding protein [Microbacterium sp. ASV49]|uniref:ATP-binding cassette domain-containing protein n=1 Tax=Microbacterium candidum TaxID=3041922 RepID=A0ABT7MYH6_9MICO|nr:ATP-binding cassette domain-containing protein [Microbacterium sp. ASV49]MDL9979504.1 ATP-binding cassette domain-containing protein [Microbacterium sp. ASV49]